MSQLFDDISRIVGSPIPRRRAIKAIGGAVVGAFLGASVFRRLGSAQTPTRCCRGSGGACILPAPLPCQRTSDAREVCGPGRRVAGGPLLLPRRPHLPTGRNLLRGHVLRLQLELFRRRGVLPDDAVVRELHRRLLSGRHRLRPRHAGVLSGGAVLPRQSDLLSERHDLH